MMRGTSALAALGAVVIAAFGVAGPAAAHGAGGELARVKKATAKYHSVDAAIVDGYAPAHKCVELPGVGGMGYHYVSDANMADGVIDPVRPEVLVYAPAPNGVRLAAVEYLAIDADQNLGTDADRPSVFGVPFDGPMPGHDPGMPIHYDLHAWVWKHNPDGVFAAWNPTVRCPQH